MKTALFTFLASGIFLFAGFMPGKVLAQKPKTKTDKIIIRSSDDKPMVMENLRDTIIVSNDGKDTTIIKTTMEGKEKKVTVRKIITSGITEDNMHWVEAETETLDKGDGDQVIVRKHKGDEPRTIFIEKRINRDGEADSVVLKEIRHMKPGSDMDMNIDEPAGKRHKTVTVITEDGKTIEKEEGDNTTVIYIREDGKDGHHKSKKHGKHRKTYTIEETKTINK